MNRDPNPMERIIGIVFSGFAVKAGAAIAAVYVASEVFAFIHQTFGAMGAAFGTH